MTLNLGQIDFEAVQNEVETTISRYKSRYPPLKESTVRGFKSKYGNEIKIAAIQKKTAARGNLLSTKGTTSFARPNRRYGSELYKGEYIFILILIN